MLGKVGAAYSANCKGSSRMPKLCWINRQLAQAFARGGEDRIRDRGSDGGRSRFAHPTGGFGILDDVHLDGRRLIHAKHAVSVEVGLFDAPVFEGDFSEKSGRD